MIPTLLLLVAVIPALGQPGFELAREGGSSAAIRLTGDTDVERLAAAELGKYVALCTGATLPVGTASTEREIVLHSGDGDGVDTSYAIEVSPTSLHISGACPVAVLYGVYDLLQTHLGCRWYAGGAVGEVTPRVDRVTIPTGTRAEAPDFAFRTFFLRREDEMWWALRNRLNGFYTREFVTSLGSGTRRSLIYLASGQGGIHAWYNIVPAERYYDTHPECFALVNGKRVRSSLRTGQLCTTNPDVIDLVAQTAREYFLADPDARVFSIAPNDGYGWCECEDCRALDEKLGGARKWRGDRPVVTDRLVTFANEVARKAREGLPGRELFIFSYVNYVVPPQVAVPDEGVTVWVCHYAPACYAHPIRQADCPDNAEFLGHLTTWAKWPQRLGIYAYTDKSMWEGMPRPVVRQMMDDIELFHALGIPRYVAQSAAQAWGQMGALYWLTTRKLWTADAPIEPLLDDWYTGFFAEAAQPMRAFTTTLEQAVASSGAHYSDQPRTQGPQVLSEQSIIDAREHLRQASALATGAQVKARVAKTVSSFEYGAAYLEYCRAYARYGETGDRAALQRAIELAKAIVEGGGNRGQEFKAVLSGLEQEQETGVLWVGFGSEEELGGRTCRNSDETGPGDNAAGWATFETFIADRATAHKLTMAVWGKSTAFTPVICSKGKGAGTGAGGVWTPLKLMDGKLSGQEQWDTLTYLIEPEHLDPESAKQRIGFGGADSQVWVSEARVE